MARRSRPRLLADPTPLRVSRQFRLLTVGQVVSAVGSQMTLVAVPYQVWVLTHSSLAVGLVGLVELVPLVLCSLLGGSLADAVERRRVLLAAQGALGATSAGLALNALATRPALWVVYLLAGLAAGFSGLEVTTRRAVIPGLVGDELIRASAALNAVLVRSTQVIGPALAGLVIETAGLGAAYWIDVISYGACVAALMAMRSMPPEGGGTRVSIESFREGMRFLARDRLLQAAFLIDINAMVFGMPRALFPALGTEVFGGGAGTVGLLYAAPAAGAFLGALSSGWVGGVRRHGMAIVVSILGWGAAITAFGLVTWLPLALALLAAAGAADIISEVFRSTLIQVVVPERLRGRMSAVFIVQVTGSPRLGDVESGAVAALTTPTISVVSGGIACLVGTVLIARRSPELLRWRPKFRAGSG